MGHSEESPITYYGTHFCWMQVLWSSQNEFFKNGNKMIRMRIFIYVNACELRFSI